jgi:hypothetical protein
VRKPLAAVVRRDSEAGAARGAEQRTEVSRCEWPDVLTLERPARIDGVDVGGVWRQVDDAHPTRIAIDPFQRVVVGVENAVAVFAISPSPSLVQGIERLPAMPYGSKRKMIGVCRNPGTSPGPSSTPSVRNLGVE